MGKLTEKQRMNKRELLKDDATRGIDRAVLNSLYNSAAINLSDLYAREKFAQEVITAIERCHVISERIRR